MKNRISRFCCLFLIAVFLASCSLESPPTPSPTLPPPTGTSSTAQPPTASPSPTSMPTPSLPTASATIEPTSPYSALTSLDATPTPPPGWLTYTNELMGYGFNYPPYASLSESGAAGMDVNEEVPPGFTYDQYFDYVLALLQHDLCITLHYPAIWITITPPYDLAGSYIGPCPGMGIGSQYNMEEASLPFIIAGHVYPESHGTILTLQSTGAFQGEFYRVNLENGFRVTLNGRPSEGMTYEEYLVQRALAFKVLATLHWFRTPNFTKPGTTCAGANTWLLPGISAVVTGSAGDPPNRLRSGPGISYEVLFQLYPQTVVKILEGPVCADGFVFWKVKDDTIAAEIGWTVESDGTQYWLEPYAP